VVATPSIDDTAEHKSVRGKSRAARAIYHSPRLNVATNGSDFVFIDVSFRPDMLDIDALRDALTDTAATGKRVSAGSIALIEAKTVRGALKDAFSDMLRVIFADEFDKVAEAYRTLLHENITKRDDPALKSALNRARLQERILAETVMVDQGQACELLGLSTTNPSATMKRKEERSELLRFTVDGRAVYPLFQFDVEGRRVVPAMAALIARKPAHWSDFRLLHWLTRPHLDFDGAPAEALRSQGDAVLAAFDREIEPPVHG
jgi:hypothetical protein